MKKPRVLMADDHSLILAGLRKLVEDECEVVGTVEDGRALVEAAQKLRPDLILLDISMPLLNGLEAARQLRTLVPESKLAPARGSGRRPNAVSPARRHR